MRADLLEQGLFGSGGGGRVETRLLSQDGKLRSVRFARLLNLCHPLQMSWAIAAMPLGG